MKSIRNFFTFIIILVAIGAALYTQRVAISNWMRERTAPELPVAVEYGKVGASGGEEEEKRKKEEENEEAKEKEEVASSEGEAKAEENEKEILPEPVEGNNVQVPSPSTSSGDNTAPDNAPSDDTLPDSFNLAVPFTSQAPHGNWSEPFKEACEEASLYMVHAYFQGVKETPIDPDTATTELQKIVAFEKELFGYYEDTTTEQTGTLAELMYGYANVETIDNPTVEQIKTHVAAGRPVIVPLAGRQLGNPFFTAPGPIYHMLVIRGYTKDGKFITNDPGTKHGEAYLYDFDTVMNAMHDWSGGGEITEGKKIVLIVYP